MKRLSILLTAAFILAVAGCADPMEERGTDEVGAQLQRGVTGQGTIGPIDRSPDDPAGQHGVPQNHP
ncbi:MAG: hypothetical protein QOI34_1786 [Verrucomicrobiota bacterium]|jgi:hypothetical protein